MILAEIKLSFLSDSNIEPEMDNAMLLRSNELINGIEPKIAKMIARICNADCPSLETIAKTIKMDVETVEKGVGALESAGFVEYRDERGKCGWCCTKKGTTELIFARFGKPIEKAEVEKLLYQVIEKAKAYNQSNEFPLHVNELIAYGPVAEERLEIDKVDIEVLFEVRPEYRMQNDWQREYVNKKRPNRALTIAGYGMFAQEELSRYLRGKSRKIRITFGEDLSKLFAAFKTIYKRENDTRVPEQRIDIDDTKRIKRHSGQNDSPKSKSDHRSIVNQNFEEELFLEGQIKSYIAKGAERSRKARKACVDHYGCTCLVCGLNFEDSFGSEFAGIIDIHHLFPLRDTKCEREVDPIRDMVPLCPNCHRMAHSKQDGLFSLDELRALVHIR